VRKAPGFPQVNYWLPAGQLKERLRLGRPSRKKNRVLERKARGFPLGRRRSRISCLFLHSACLQL